MEQTVDMQEDGWVYFKASPRGETRKHTQKDKKNKTKPADILRLSCYYTTLKLICGALHFLFMS